MAEAAKQDNPGAVMAAEIYQQVLDVVSKGLLTGKIDTVLSHCHVPMVVKTAERTQVFENVQSLREDARHHSTSLIKQGVTDYVRLVRRARFLAEDAIEGHHDTYILRNALMLVPRYQSRMIMRKVGDFWQTAEAEHNITDQRFPIEQLRPASSPLVDLPNQPGAAAERSEFAQAKPIYVAFLKSLSAAQNNCDFDRWAGHFAYPLDVKLATQHLRIGGPLELNSYFDASVARDQDLGTVYERVVEEAEFTAPDTIKGRHSGHLFGAHSGWKTTVPGEMTLTLMGGQWRCTGVRTALDNTTLEDCVTNPKPLDGKAAPKFRDERTEE